jgi:hypothetical protein
LSETLDGVRRSEQVVLSVFLVVLSVVRSFTGDREHRRVGCDAAAALTSWEEAALIPCQCSRVGTVPSPWAGLRVNICVEKPHT